MEEALWLAVIPPFPPPTQDTNDRVLEVWRKFFCMSRLSWWGIAQAMAIWGPGNHKGKVLNRLCSPLVAVGSAHRCTICMHVSPEWKTSLHPTSRPSPATRWEAELEICYPHRDGSSNPQSLTMRKRAGRFLSAWLWYFWKVGLWDFFFSLLSWKSPPYAGWTAGYDFFTLRKHFPPYRGDKVELLVFQLL